MSGLQGAGQDKLGEGCEWSVDIDRIWGSVTLSKS